MESSSHDGQPIDVLIGGAGFAGLALAIALRQGLGSAFSVTVADPALARAASDPRATAIVAAARRLFETIGVWQAIPAQPILDMVVTDSRVQDAMRPTFLTFDGDVEQGEPFAHMIENGPLLAALDPDQVAVVRRLIPVVVDATSHHLLWTLEQWPEVHLGVTLPVEAVSDVRQVALGDLQGYLYDWIPCFSQEAHDLTTLEQGEP